MRRKALATVAAVLLSACSPRAAHDAVPRDEALVQALQGSWCVTEDNGKTCWGYDTFERNTISGCGVIPESNQKLRASATFRVSGTTACYEVTSTDDPSNFPVGHTFCTEVLAISASSQTYKHLDSGETYTTFRVPASAVACPGDA
jgi:hypothetical protein